MKTAILTFLICALTTFSARDTVAQTEHSFSINPRVGDTVDVEESRYFGLFAGYPNFQQGVLFQRNGSDRVFAHIKMKSKDTVISFAQIFATEISAYIDSFEYHTAYSDPSADSTSWIAQKEIQGIMSRTFRHSLYAETISIVLRDGTNITGSIAHITESEIVLYPAMRMVSLADRPLQIINKRSIEKFNSPFELLVKGNEDAYKLAYKRLILTDNNWWQNSDLQQSALAPEIIRILANKPPPPQTDPPETTGNLHRNYWDTRLFITAMLTYGKVSTGLVQTDSKSGSTQLRSEDVFTYEGGICYRVLAEYEPITSFRFGAYYEQVDYQPINLNYRKFDWGNAFGLSIRYVYIIGKPLAPPMFSFTGGVGISFSNYSYSYSFQNTYDSVSFAERVEGTLTRWNINVGVRYNFLKNFATSLSWMYDVGSVSNLPKGFYFNKFGRIYSQSYSQNSGKSGLGTFWLGIEAGF